MTLARLDDDDVAGADLLHAALGADEADAVDDVQRLALGVCVPDGARAGREADVGAADGGVVVDAKPTAMVNSVAKTVKNAVTNKLDPLVEIYAQMFAHGVRAPVLRRPDEYGMPYEDVFFPSMDGITLAGWFIPAEGSDKLLITNHPMTCNRYGFPGHLAPWNTMFGGSEVNFLPQLKALHDAGYNISPRTCATMDAAPPTPAGTSGLGLVECGDVVGSVRYAKQRWPEMTLGLWSRCMGGNSTITAMDLYPDEFTDIKALGVLNVVSGRTFIEKGAELAKMDPAKAAERLDVRMYELTGFRLDEETPRPHAHAVRVPTFMAQLKRDFLIHAEQDGQEIFDALGADDKELC